MSFCLIFTLVCHKKYVLVCICTVSCTTFGVALYYVEKHSGSPILPLQMMINPVTSISAVTLLNNMLFTGVMFILPQYAHMMGFSSTVTAIIMSVCGAVNIVLSIALPKLQKLIVNRFILIIASVAFVLTTILSIIFIRT